MGRPTKTIGLQYSTDGGVTFSTAIELKVRSIRVWKEPEISVEETGVTGRKFEKRFAYLNIDLETDEYEFDPEYEASSGDADSNWQELQNFCDADTRRIYNGDTTNVPNLDSYTEFNSSSNTNYVNLLSFRPLYRPGDTYPGGRRPRAAILEMQTRSAV